MHNLTIAKIYDHISGKKKDDDIEVTLSSLSQTDREKLVLSIINEEGIPEELIAFITRKVGSPDDKIIRLFPNWLKPYVIDVLKQYYRRKLL
jgi:hypothetical protein